MRSITWDNDITNYLLHHYTSLESLSMILKNKTIQLNRLDLSNDPLERNANDIENFGKFFFFSSWIYETEESIPMWRMYASNPIEYGVRISLPRYFYKIWHKDFGSPITYDQLKSIEIPSSRSISEISIMKLGDEMEIFHNHNIYLQYGLKTNEFPLKVEYVESDSDLANNYYSHMTSKENNEINALCVPSEIGRTKHKRWQYENEYRYLIEVYRNNLRPLANINSDEIDKVVALFVERAKQYEPPYTKLDLSIHESAFKKMVITLNPMASEGFKHLVNSLVANFYNDTGINIKVEGSILKNKLLLKR